MYTEEDAFIRRNLGDKVGERRYEIVYDPEALYIAQEKGEFVE